MDRFTWNALIAAYNNTINNLPPDLLSFSSEIYPGRFLSLGMQGDDVEDLQMFLQRAARNDPSIPPVPVSYTHLDVYKRQELNQWLIPFDVRYGEAMRQIFLYILAHYL